MLDIWEALAACSRRCHNLHLELDVEASSICLHPFYKPSGEDGSSAELVYMDQFQNVIGRNLEDFNGCMRISPMNSTFALLVRETIVCVVPSSSAMSELIDPASLRNCSTDFRIRDYQILLVLSISS